MVRGSSSADSNHGRVACRHHEAGSGCRQHSQFPTRASARSPSSVPGCRASNCSPGNGAIGQSCSGIGGRCAPQAVALAPQGTRLTPDRLWAPIVPQPVFASRDSRIFAKTPILSKRPTGCVARATGVLRDFSHTGGLDLLAEHVRCTPWSAGGGACARTNLLPSSSAVSSSDSQVRFGK